MARGTVLQAIKAKPNHKAIVRFRKPLYCNCAPHKDQDEITALTSITREGKTTRKCAAHVFNPPQVVAPTKTQQILKQLGLL